MSQLMGALNGFPVVGRKKNANIQALYTLAFCGNDEQFKTIEKLHNCSEYHQACLYAHAVSKTSLEWLAEEFFNDAKSLKNGSSNYIQFTSYSIGLALNKNENPDISKKDIEKIIKKLAQLVDSAELTSEQLTSCVLALGWSYPT